MEDANDEQIMDQAFIDDLNTRPIDHRLLLLEKFFKTAISFCDVDEGCRRAHVVDTELLRLTMNMLHSMANNDGKIFDKLTPFTDDQGY